MKKEYFEKIKRAQEEKKKPLDFSVIPTEQTSQLSGVLSEAQAVPGEVADVGFTIETKYDAPDSPRRTG